MPAIEIHVVPDSRVLLGESPLWHPEEQVLYWIDIAGLAVHRYDPARNERASWDMPAEPGCIAWSAAGGLLVAMRTGIAMLDTRTGVLKHLIDAPYDPSRIRFNDGRCDAAGRLWIGTLSDDRSQPLGALYCLERGVIREVGNPVTVSNGLAFSTDNSKIYHADTSAHRISVYDFDLAVGSLGVGRVFQSFDSNKAQNYGGRPDGASVDSTDSYWCAMYEGGRLLCISPGGCILRVVDLPVRCPTMPAFGGPDFKTVYITTVRNKRPDAELHAYPLSGSVLTLRVDIPGRPEHAYIP